MHRNLPRRLVVPLVCLAAVAAVTPAAEGKRTPAAKGGVTSVDLLASSNLRIDGANPGDGAGTSVAPAGDVNDDGLPDVIVGAPSVGGAGAAYVVLGQLLPTTIDLSALSSGQGFVITGASAGDRAGFSVASAGDVDGDGYGDVLVGAPGASNAGPGSGSAYLVYGSASPGDVDLGSLGSAGVRFDGENVGDQAGYSVAGIGDTSNDGARDLLIGAPDSSANGADSGAAYVVYGSSGLSGGSLGSLGSGGYRLSGAAAGNHAGFAVAAGGDENTDNHSDFVVGAPDASPSGRTAAGTVYYVFGQGSSSNKSLSTIVSGKLGFRILGQTGGDRLGSSLANIGDFDTDGEIDIAMGAPGASYNGRPGSGSVYISYGPKSWRTANELDLSTAVPALSHRFLRFDGEVAGDALGTSVAGAGDVNGDGQTDLLLGAADASPLGRSGAGAAYLARGFHHIARHEQIINLSAGSTRVSITRYSGGAGEHVGSSVAGGVAWSGGALDILLGGDLASQNGRADSGSIYGVFGP